MEYEISMDAIGARYCPGKPEATVQAAEIPAVCGYSKIQIDIVFFREPSVPLPFRPFPKVPGQSDETYREQ